MKEIPTGCSNGISNIFLAGMMLLEIAYMKFYRPLLVYPVEIPSKKCQ